jgi:hypothetical protein
MMQSETTAFLAWLVEQGLAGANAPVLLEGFVRRCAEAGLHLSRAVVFIDTLHPIFEGGGARWSDGDAGCGTCRNTGYMACRSCRGGGTAVPIKATIPVREQPRE